jgi:hypothetical protein
VRDPNVGNSSVDGRDNVVDSRNNVVRDPKGGNSSVDTIHNDISVDTIYNDVTTESGERVNDNRIKMTDNADTEIPEEVQNWLRDAHGALSGHLGFEGTVRNLFECKSFRRASLRGSTPVNMNEIIKKWIKSCDTCQKMRVNKPSVQADHFTCSVYNPMQRVAIDYIEKLTADRWGNDMIIVIIDCFSRFVVLYPVQSTKVKVFADTFIKWASIFGTPDEVLSDQGSQFLSDLIREVYELTKTRCVFTIPNSKQENAIVERANREVMRHLRCIVYDERVLREWSMHVPFVQRIMNSMLHSSTGLKPCQIVFGRDFSQEFITDAGGEESSVCVLRLAHSDASRAGEEREETIEVIEGYRSGMLELLG